MLMLAITILILFLSLGITGCVGTRGAPLVNIINVEQAEEEVVVPRPPVRRIPRR